MKSREPARGRLAIVLHSHMPYVEGFGTYPFGEEWLFDAVARSYLPLLGLARDLTMTVTPVLADQLEAEGVAERMRSFIAGARLRACELDAAEVEADLRPAAEHHARRYAEALARLDRLGGDVLGGFAAAEREGRIALMASAATHAVLPQLATRRGRALQIDSGLRSHRRRFGWSGGFWLPECGYRPGMERLLADHGVTYFCVDQSPHEAPLDALAPVRTEAGPVAFTIDWETISLVWSLEGYPSDPLYADFHRGSLRGARLWGIDGLPYRPAAAAERAAAHAGEFLTAVAARLDAYSEARAKQGLLVFAIDTELLGHWWHEGPLWLEAVLRGAAAHGIELVRLPEAARTAEPERRPLAAASWGEAKDFSTWDGPEVADLAWGARRLELRLLRSLDAGAIGGRAAERAARELLALQASDWAFLDSRGQAGDYPYVRTLCHAEAFLEALDSRAAHEPKLRNLAPDLRLAPLIEP